VENLVNCYKAHQSSEAFSLLYFFYSFYPPFLLYSQSIHRFLPPILISILNPPRHSTPSLHFTSLFTHPFCLACQKLIQLFVSSFIYFISSSYNFLDIYRIIVTISFLISCRPQDCLPVLPVRSALPGAPSLPAWASFEIAIAQCYVSRSIASAPW